MSDDRKAKVESPYTTALRAWYGVVWRRERTQPRPDDPVEYPELFVDEPDWFNAYAERFIVMGGPGRDGGFVRAGIAGWRADGVTPESLGSVGIGDTFRAPAGVEWGEPQQGTVIASDARGFYVQLPDGQIIRDQAEAAALLRAEGGDADPTMPAIMGLLSRLMPSSVPSGDSPTTGRRWRKRSSGMSIARALVIDGLSERIGKRAAARQLLSWDAALAGRPEAVTPAMEAAVLRDVTRTMGKHAGWRWRYLARSA